CRTSMDGGDGLSTGSALACLRRGVLHLSQEDTKVLGGRMATAMAEWRPRTAEGPAVALAGTTIAFRLADGTTYTAVERASLTGAGRAGFGGRYPHMLAGGQRKRVGLAQVLIRDPKILLMDEPFGPLDAQTRQIMGNLLLELWNADRKAVLFVTHDLEEAIALADRVVIMSAGPSARIIGDWRVTL